MLLLYVLIYLIIGIMAISTLVIIHMVRAIRRGYNIETIYTVHIELNRGLWSSCNKPRCIARYILGVIIWPIRCVQFLRNDEQYMNMYKHYEEIES